MKNIKHQPPQRRNPVAKALPRLRGGPHRSRPNRADLKRELRRNLAEGLDPARAVNVKVVVCAAAMRLWSARS